MVKKWGASRLKLPHSEVAGCPTDWAMEFSHGPLTQVVKYICASPTVCPCHYRVSCILTDLSVVLMSVWLVVLACCVDSCHSLVRDGLRSVSYMDVAHISPIDPCWRSPLIGLVQLIWLGRCCGIFRGSVAWRGCFSSVKSQFRSDGRSLSTWHRRILQIVTTWRLEDDTWTMERIDIRCLLAESLPSVLMFWQVEVLYQHLNAGTPSWHGVVGPADVLDGLRSRDRTVHKFVREGNALSRTNGQVPARCAGFSLSWFACSCCLLDISYHPVDIGSRCTVFQDMYFLKQLWRHGCFCMPLSFHSATGATARCGLSTAILSVTFSWHTASTL